MCFALVDSQCSSTFARISATKKQSESWQGCKWLTIRSSGWLNPVSRLIHLHPTLLLSEPNILLCRIVEEGGRAECMNKSVSALKCPSPVNCAEQSGVKVHQLLGRNWQRNRQFHHYRSNKWRLYRGCQQSINVARWWGQAATSLWMRLDALPSTTLNRNNLHVAPLNKHADQELCAQMTRFRWEFQRN